MAIDKAVDSAVLDSQFTDIANAIREKNGETVQYTPSEMAAAIAGLSTGMTVKRGTVNGTGAQQYVSTGLNTVTYFFIYANEKVNTLGLDIITYDATGAVLWCVCYTGTGLYTAINPSGVFFASGGNIRIGHSSANYYKIRANKTYTWIAVGS